ncbi:dihydroorotase [Granulicatella balaenopterae]|uniref:Dihydroorotase n=2 Tax=Granulicatella balaenopterae TaxID=137733 RepID=A0A1H9MF37_9LACT|nr:dihydroorotase [Granulicatella balaenopterae]
MIVTDHAPHTVEEKECSMTQASFGIVGSETAFAQLYTAFVKTNRWTLQQLVDYLTIKPAKVFSLPYGRLEVGGLADLTVIDLQKESVIDPDSFESKGRNTPFSGQKVYGMPVMTICDGKIAWQAATFKGE